ncbi:hypothetical protein [uncultured Bacteroides sp.]|uniref:hypothetical protein n=1 Tax=uncultured Bacteroides sp. TaxID=162156 RepID=UPI00280B4246|nr:hypothetical protein [uncultured Bacteroides sp.]
MRTFLFTHVDRQWTSMVLRKEMEHLKDKAMGKDGLNSGSVPRSCLNFVADSK